MITKIMDRVYIGSNKVPGVVVGYHEGRVLVDTIFSGTYRVVPEQLESMPLPKGVINIVSNIPTADLENFREELNKIIGKDEAWARTRIKK